MLKKTKIKIIKSILNIYCSLLFGKNKNLNEEKKQKINLITDLYLDKEINVEEWQLNIKKILEIKNERRKRR